MYTFLYSSKLRMNLPTQSVENGVILETINNNSVITVTSNSNELVHGLFGQGLTWVLESLCTLENERVLPNHVIWDINAKAYGQVIPGVLLPLQRPTPDQLIRDETTNHPMVDLKHRSSAPFALETESFRQAHDLLHRWFSIEPSISDRVPQAINQHWLGIHYRGTDKQLDKNETEPVSKSEFLTLIVDFCEQSAFEGLFVCSDEQGFVAQVAAALPNLKITSIDQMRSADSRSLHFEQIPETQQGKHEMASFAMSDVVALSRCGHVLKCSSALSAWAKILRPECQLHQVAVTKHPWFPLSVVPMYEPKSDAAKRIMKRVS